MDNSVILDKNIQREQLKYVTDLAQVIDFAQLENTELFFGNDTNCSAVKLAAGGIVVDNILYKLPHTAAIAYSKHHQAFQDSNDGWKEWFVSRNGLDVTLETLRDELLDYKMEQGIVVCDENYSAKP